VAFRAGSVLGGTSTTSAAVPVPTGAAIGDIAVVGIYKESTAAITPPTGFTQKSSLTTSATARGSLTVFWKRLTAADTGTWTFTWSAATYRASVGAVFSGRIATGDPFDGTVGTAESTTGVTTLNVSTSPAAASGDAVGMWTNFNGGASWTAPANYTQRNNTAEMVMETRDNVAAGTTGNVTATATITDFMKAFIGVLAAATGGGSTSLTLGLATETDAAKVLAASKTITLGVATETDAAYALSYARTVTLGRAQETDTAYSVVGTHALSVSTATETDQARGLTSTKTVTLGVAHETDTAYVLTSNGASTVLLGRAQETDAGLQLAAVKAVTLGVATEVEAAHALTYTRSVVLDTAIETETAYALTVHAGGPRRNITIISLTEPTSGWSTTAPESTLVMSGSVPNTSWVTTGPETDWVTTGPELNPWTTTEPEL
jgi:hypothetical protein